MQLDKNIIYNYFLKKETRINIDLFSVYADFSLAPPTGLLNDSKNIITLLTSFYIIILPFLDKYN